MTSATSAPMTRRFVLSTLATGAAIAATGSAGATSPEGNTSMRTEEIGAPGAARVATMIDLIEAHRAAVVRVETADKEYNRCDLRLDELKEEDEGLNVPLAVWPDGQCDSGFKHYAWGIRATATSKATAEIARAIADVHADLRRLHCSKWTRTMFPDLAAAAEAELAASEARALAALAAAETRFKELRAQTGYDAAYREREAAWHVEFVARLDLVAYVPRSEAEAEARRTYAENCSVFRDGWHYDDVFIQALMERLGILKEAPAYTPDDEDDGTEGIDLAGDQVAA
jgi:hypothetical protein